MKLKNIEALNIYNAILNLQGDFNVKFSYALAKNMKKLEPEKEAFEKALEPSDKIKEYGRKLEEIKKKYPLRDKDGNKIPGNIQGSVQIDFTNKDLEKEIKDLELEYKEDIEAENAKAEEKESLMNEEVEVDLFQIDIKDFPKEINPKLMYVLQPLVKE